MKAKRFFYARPCDEPAPGWCVAEFENGPKGIKWSSTLYEPALSRLADGDESVALVGMTKKQALREAALWCKRGQERLAKAKKRKK